MRPIAIIAVVVLGLTACAPKRTGFSPSMVNQKLAELAGTRQPDNVTLSSLYKKTITYHANNRFACNDSSILKEEASFTITLGSGNMFSGTVSSVDDCGKVENQPVHGRYNDSEIYIAIPGGHILRYRIKNEGRLLEPVENIALLDGREHRRSLSNIPNLTQTPYVSQVDRSTNTSPAQERSLSDKLMELKKLLDSGIIDQATYESKKQSLIDAY